MASSSALRVQKHRTVQRKQGQRLVQMWLPDITLPAFVRATRKAVERAKQASDTAEAQAFLDSFDVLDDPE